MGTPTHLAAHVQVTHTQYLQEHGSLVRREVGGQDIPEPDDDPVAPVKTAVVHGVLPESKADGRRNNVWIWGAPAGSHGPQGE